MFYTERERSSGHLVINMLLYCYREENPYTIIFTLQTQEGTVITILNTQPESWTVSINSLNRKFRKVHFKPTVNL